MFTSDADFQRADWPLLQHASVNLFWNRDILADACDDLKHLGYGIAEVTCRAGLPCFYEQVSTTLNWQEQFGYSPWNGNLNALNDGFRDYPFGPSRRSALVFDGFHLLVEEDKAFAHALLDIVESSARDYLLRGQILVTLVQTDDNRYECPPIGSRHAGWNFREWMDAHRGI